MTLGPKLSILKSSYKKILAKLDGLLYGHVKKNLGVRSMFNSIKLEFGRPLAE